MEISPSIEFLLPLKLLKLLLNPFKKEFWFGDLFEVLEYLSIVAELFISKEFFLFSFLKDIGLYKVKLIFFIL